MTALALPALCPGVLPLADSSEATRRAAVVAAARSWIGTPYRQQGYVKGPRGAVDCAMLLVGAYVEAGIFEPFDPRPYPPTWFLHNSEERYLEWMTSLADEVEHPEPGDVLVWKFGRCFSHSGILLEDGASVVHAYAVSGMCCASSLAAPALRYLGRSSEPRPRRAFSLFRRLRRLSEV